MDNATDKLPPSAEDFASPWSSGSLSARVEKALRLLEQRCVDMEKKGVSREQLENMRGSLEQMKRRLDFLRRVKEKVWEGIHRVKRIFIGG